MLPSRGGSKLPKSRRRRPKQRPRSRARLAKKHSRGDKVTFAINQKGGGVNGRDKQIVQCQDYDISAIVLGSLNEGKISIEEAVKQVNAWRTDGTLPP